jgi:signal transduction histidine kinase
VKQYLTAKDGTGPNHPYVFTILKDSYHNIWLGTPTGGLNLFDPLTESFIYFQHKPENEYSLSNDIVLCLHEDEQHYLWIGTSGGLNKLIPKLSPNIFQKYGTEIATETDSLFINLGYEQGFPNDVIYGILEDHQHRLWLSTNKGLVVFDMDGHKLIKAMDVSDGLQSNEFNQNSYHIGNKGCFYFGGVNGFNRLHPERMSANPFVPPVVLTGLSIFNKPVDFCEDDTNKMFCLDRNIQYLDELRLSYKHNFITLKFAALSYISPEKNQYSYMLEGLNNDWINTGNDRMATFTHLPAGNYVFKLKASNNNGIWNEEIKALKIHISAPPWLSWYAYLFYFIVAIGIVYLFLWYRITKATRKLKVQAQIEKARSQEREAFRKKSAADFHDEAGNRITKISLFTEMARNEIHHNPQLASYLQKIQANIAELSAGMRDFLWVLDPQQDSLFETIARLRDYGDSSLTEMGVRFTMSGINAELRKITLPMNTRRDMLQIFKEAINNCAKHASAEHVILSIHFIDNSLIISLTDNGKGFDTEKADLKNKYGLAIMRERARKINAELVIISQINQGTSVTLKCKIPHLSNSE